MTRVRLASVAVLFVLVAARQLRRRQAGKAHAERGATSRAGLIGSWTGTGLPEGTREEKQKGLWEETIRWEWQFKDKDVFLKATIEKGKYFTAAELRYLPEKDAYQLTATTPAKDKLVYEGQLKDKRLTLERTDDKTKEQQRLTINLLHDNYYRTIYEVKAAEKPSFKTVYQVGVKSNELPFPQVDHSKDCIVSGGQGRFR